MSLIIQISTWLYRPLDPDTMFPGMGALLVDISSYSIQCDQGWAQASYIKGLRPFFFLVEKSVNTRYHYVAAMCAYMCESWWFNYIFVPLFIIIVRGWSTDHRQRCLTNVSRYEWEAVGLQGTDVGSKVHCVDSGHFSATNVSKDLDNNVCEDLANPAWLWDSLFCQTSSSHGKQSPWRWWETFLGVQRSRQYVAKSLSRGKQGSEGTHRDHLS